MGRPQVAGVAITGHQIVEVGGRVVKRPPVRLLHVPLRDLVSLGVHVDQHLRARPQELPPDHAALLAHVCQGQLLHLPDSLNEEEVLRRVLLLQKLPKVVVTHGVLEQVPAAEGPAPDPADSHLLPGTLLEHLPELGGVRDPGVAWLGGHQEGVVLVVEVEELDVGLGALGHSYRALVNPGAEVGSFITESASDNSDIPSKRRERKTRRE